MSSLREKRGIGGLDPDEKRKQWNITMANRALQSLFPEVTSDNGEKVITNNIGREKYYMSHPEAFDNMTYEYFRDIVENNEAGVEITPDIEDFCIFVGISRLGLMRLEQCSDLAMNQRVERVRTAIANCKKQLALDGKIPSMIFAIDFNNNHDYVQAKQELQITRQEIDAKGSASEIASRLMDAIEAH